MRYRIIHHLESKDDFLVNSIYGMQRILRSVINREQDTLFVITMNGEGQLYNLHMYPVKDIKSLKEQISKVLFDMGQDQASRISIAFNFSYRNEEHEKMCKHEWKNIIENDEYGLRAILHCDAGNYRVVHQAKYKPC